MLGHEVASFEVVSSSNGATVLLGVAGPEDLHSVSEEPKPKGFGARLKRFFLGDKMDKKRLQQLGMGAVASYGFVSNLTYGTGLAISWIAFVQQLGKSFNQGCFMQLYVYFHCMRLAV